MPVDATFLQRTSGSADCGGKPIDLATCQSVNVRKAYSFFNGFNPMPPSSEWVIEGCSPVEGDAGFYENSCFNSSAHPPGCLAVTQASIATLYFNVYPHNTSSASTPTCDSGSCSSCNKYDCICGVPGAHGCRTLEGPTPACRRTAARPPASSPVHNTHPQPTHRQAVVTTPSFLRRREGDCQVPEHELAADDGVPSMDPRGHRQRPLAAAGLTNRRPERGKVVTVRRRHHDEHHGQCSAAVAELSKDRLLRPSPFLPLQELAHLPTPEPLVDSPPPTVQVPGQETLTVRRVDANDPDAGNPNTAVTLMCCNGA